jgi:hypothetical protein
MLAGTSLTSLQQSAYIYVYQVTSANGTSPTVFALPNTPAITSLAYATTSTFNGSPTASTSVSSSNFEANTASNAASSYGWAGNSFAYNGAPDIEFTWNDQSSLSNLTPGVVTNLLIVGSNIGPGAGIIETADGGWDVSFGAPVPGPEPGTFALLSLAFPVFGIGYVRRLRNRLRATVGTVA